MPLEKQEHLTVYLPGYVTEDNEFHHDWMSRFYTDREEAWEHAKEYTTQGLELLSNWGFDSPSLCASMKPAIVARHVYYEELEPEVWGE